MRYQRACSALLLTLALICASLGKSQTPDLFYQHRLKHAGFLSRLNPNIGDPIDLSERRPVVDLADTLFESFYGAKNGYLLIANFYHQQNFWIARIPENGVASVDLMFSMFSPIAAHTFLRFNMSTPIELIARVPDHLPENRSWTTRDLKNPLQSPILKDHLVVSSEAQWTTTDRKKKYGLIRGALGQFVQITRVVSLDERFRNYLVTANPVAQLATRLSPTEASQTLLNALQLSEREGAHTYYNTLTHNCTTTSVDLATQSLPPYALCLRPALNVSRSLPFLERFWGAKARGLVAPDTETTWLHDDQTVSHIGQSAVQSFLESRSLTEVGAQAASYSKRTAVEKWALANLAASPICAIFE